MRSGIVACGVAVLALLWSSAGLAMDPAIRCQADKLKIASKYAACRLKAEAKAAKRFKAPDFAKCDEVFLAAWEATEARTIARGTPCWTTGDSADAQAAIVAFTDSLAHSVSQDGGAD